jgi:hypothetical protein
MPQNRLLLDLGKRNRVPCIIRAVDREHRERIIILNRLPPSPVVIEEAAPSFVSPTSSAHLKVINRLSDFLCRDLDRMVTSLLCFAELSAFAVRPIACNKKIRKYFVEFLWKLAGVEKSFETEGFWLGSGNDAGQLNSGSANSGFRFLGLRSNPSVVFPQNSDVGPLIIDEKKDNEERKEIYEEGDSSETRSPLPCGILISA